MEHIHCVSEVNPGEISFTIYTKPVPLQRHRHAQKIRKKYVTPHLPHCPQYITTYDPQRDEKEAHRLVMRHALVQHSPTLKDLPLVGPLFVTVRFYFELPKTKSLRDKKGLYHHQKPDLDNCVKFICDVMNDSIIYKDDSSIYKIDAAKLFTLGEARTEIIIREVEQIKGSI